MRLFEAAEVVNSKRTIFKIKEVDRMKIENFVSAEGFAEPVRVNTKKTKIQLVSGKSQSTYRMLAF